MGSIFDQKQFIFIFFFIFNPLVLDIVIIKALCFLTELFMKMSNAGFLLQYFSDKTLEDAVLLAFMDMWRSARKR